MDGANGVMDRLQYTHLTNHSASNMTGDPEAPVTTEESESLATPGESDEHSDSDELLFKDASEEWGEKSDDGWVYKDDWGVTEAVEDVDNRPPLEIVKANLTLEWKNRHEPSRYSDVTVLLISWEESDLDGIEKTHEEYQKMFEHLYKYRVRRFRIPKKKPHMALSRSLLDLAGLDRPDTLFIVWYDGHGCEHEDRRGSPQWHSHGDGKSVSVDSSIVSTTLADCEADILLVNDCCSSLVCDRFRTKGIVECISASAFNTTTDESMAWAALRILRDEKSIEEGITVTELHRQLCLAVQCSSTNNSPDYDEDNLDVPVRYKHSNIRSQPVYTRLSADKATAHGRTQGIVLHRLNREDDRWGSEPYIYRPDLVLRLNVTSMDDMDPKEWTNWLLSAPSCVQTAILAKPESEEEST